MKKYLTLVAIALAVLVGLAGCDWLFGPRVNEVEPEDLESFSAGQTFSSDEASVRAAVVEGIAGTDGSGGAGCALAYLFLSDEFQAELEDAFGSMAASFSLTELMNNMVETSIQRSRSITIDANLDDDFTDDEFSADISILIENETVNGADINLTGQGSATVERFFLEAEGSEEILAYDNYGDVEAARMAGRFEHDASVSYDGFSCDGDIVIHDGQINSEGSGRGEVTVDADTASVFWRFGYALSAGISFSNTVTDMGGKLILEFAYSGREDIEFDLDDDPDEISALLTGEVELTLVIRLYDNNDELVVEYSYTDEDVYEEFETLVI